ncbi:MFS transporter [Ruegeria arenilitoris]|uniref:MFS transporter n=1 Tax=Ruegeria arenilitoris TaxID=1173585 RepID=UPI00147A3DCF|nr:MFS transporter [Ruegeria arenilitoris]
MARSFKVLFQVVLLWMAGLGAATQFAKIAVPFTEVSSLYPEFGDAIGWLLSIVSLIGALLGALSGSITTWIGPSRLLIFGLVLGGLVSLFQATEPGFYVMLASRVVEGMSHLAIVVAAPTIMAQITVGRARNAAMVLWSTFFGVAFALNAWIGLQIVDQFGLSVFFALHGGLMILTAAILALCRIRIDLGEPGEFNWGWRALLRAHARIYSSPRVAAPPIGWFFYTLTFVSLLAILPGQFQGNTGSIVAGLMPLAGIVLSWLAVPLMLTYLTSVAVINLGFALGIAIMGTAFLGCPLTYVAIGLFAVLGLVQGGSFAAVPELNDSAETQALSYGAMAQMGNSGNLLGTPVLLAVLGLTGVDGMLVAVVGFYLAAIGAHLWLARRRMAA